MGTGRYDKILGYWDPWFDNLEVHAYFIKNGKIIKRFLSTWACGMWRQDLHHRLMVSTRHPYRLFSPPSPSRDRDGIGRCDSFTYHRLRLCTILNLIFWVYRTGDRSGPGILGSIFRGLPAFGGIIFTLLLINRGSSADMNKRPSRRWYTFIRSWNSTIASADIRSYTPQAYYPREMCAS